MTDEELIARLRWKAGAYAKEAANRIEALTKERDRFEAALGRACLVGGTTYLIEQRDAARRDAKEAEAYAEELEKELNTCRMAQAVLDNTVAGLEGKLAKAVAFLEEIAITGDWFISDMNDLIKELKGDTP